MKRRFVITILASVAIPAMLVSAYAAIVGAKKEGMVEYVGAQKDIFKTGRAASIVSLEELSSHEGLYAIGPVDGLDGEITIFSSKPYITKVRGSDYIVDHSYNHGAIFLVWTAQAKWQDVPVISTVKGYADLQQFVKTRAAAAGIDVTKPFPFLLSGSPSEIKWHINVDRINGKPITKELFAESKAGFVTKNEPVDIIAFYSEGHHGEFISQCAPAIAPETGMKNAIHIHLVSRASKAAGHIDDLTLAEGMVLRLPSQ